MDFAEVGVWYLVARLIVGVLYAAYCLWYHIKTAKFTKTDTWIFNLVYNEHSDRYHMNDCGYIERYSFEYSMINFLCAFAVYSIPFVFETVLITKFVATFNFSTAFIKDYRRNRLDFDYDDGYWEDHEEE